MARHPWLILHAPAGGGHRSAALAIEEVALRRGHRVEVLDALSLAPRWFAQFYKNMHLLTSQYMPTFYGRYFAQLNHPDATRDRLRASMDDAFGRKLRDTVRAMEPEVILATHFSPLAALGRMRLQQELQAPLAAVVTDYMTHAFWVVPGVDLFLTAPGQASLDVPKHGAPSSGVLATGIPCREAFSRLSPWRPPGPQEPLRVLVTVGGFGVGPVLEVLRGFQGLPEVTLDVVCGNRPSLVQTAREFAARHELSTEIVGFTEDMPARMERAHLVVAKPGGLTVTECLSAGRPMVLVGGCPGQESANQRLVQLAGAGGTCAPRQVGRRVLELWKHDALPLMARAARRAGTPHAARAVVTALEQYLQVSSSAQPTQLAS